MNKDISKWLIFDGCVTLQFEIDHDDGDLLFVLSKLIQWFNDSVWLWWPEQRKLKTVAIWICQCEMMICNPQLSTQHGT